MTLTRQDLSDGHNVHECAEEFRRARDFGGPTEILIWAQNWGNALVDKITNNEVDEDALEYHIETEVRPIRIAVGKAIEKLEGLAKVHHGTSTAVVIYSTVEILEKAIEQ